MRDASVIASLTKISLRSVSAEPFHTARARTVRRVVVAGGPPPRVGGAGSPGGSGTGL